jgi:hypothetical protein
MAAAAEMLDALDTPAAISRAAAATYDELAKETTDAR